MTWSQGESFCPDPFHDKTEIEKGVQALVDLVAGVEAVGGEVIVTSETGSDLAEPGERVIDTRYWKLYACPHGCDWRNPVLPPAGYCDGTELIPHRRRLREPVEVVPAPDAVVEPGGQELERVAHGDGWIRSGGNDQDFRIAVVLSVCGHSGHAVVSGYFWPSFDSFAAPLEDFRAEWTRFWVDVDEANHLASKLAETEAERDAALGRTDRAIAAAQRGLDLAEAAVARERRCRERLLERADKYEKDGKSGPLGFNCWGWRDIATGLRTAAELFPAPPPREGEDD